MADTSTVELAIHRTWGPQVADYLFFNDPVLPTLVEHGLDIGGGLDVKTMTGDRYTWPAMYEENFTAQEFTEHQALPSPGYVSFANAYVEPTYIRTVMKFTGMAEDALEGLVFFEALDREMQVAMTKLRDARNSHMLGATNNGLLHAINDTGTYASINRAVSTWFQSLVSDASGVNRTLTLALMEAIEDAQPETPYAGDFQVILTSRSQIRNYNQLPGVPGSSNAAQRINISTEGKATSIDLGSDAASFSNRPMIPVTGFDTTEMLFLDLRDGQAKMRVIRPMRAKWHHNEGDSEVYVISHGYSGLIFERINKQARLSDLTA